jgi:flagellar hook assembly protein FlgD
MVFEGGSVEWDGSDSSGRRLPPGVYFVRMEIEDLNLSRKVVLLE